MRAFINARHDKQRHVLIVTASNDARAALKDAYVRGEKHGSGYYNAEGVLAEAFLDYYEFVQPEYVPGAMTDAPILVDADDVMHPDNGEIVLTLNARVFWFPNYMVEDPFETLKNTGRVEFAEAEPYGDEPLPPLVRDDIGDYLPGGERCGELFLLGGEFAPESELPEPLREMYARHSYNRDTVDPGTYFVRHDRLYGPYAPAVGGQMNAEEAGALAPKPRAVEPEQGELGINA